MLLLDEPSVFIRTGNLTLEGKVGLDWEDGAGHVAARFQGTEANATSGRGLVAIVAIHAAHVVVRTEEIQVLGDGSAGCIGAGLNREEVMNVVCGLVLCSLNQAADG